MDYFRGQQQDRPRDTSSLLKTVFNFDHINDKTQQHLTRVYTFLIALSFVCAFGMYMNATFIVQGFFMHLISIILSIYLIFQVANRANSEDKRMIYLVALAFQMGFLAGPALHYLVQVNPELVV